MALTEPTRAVQTCLCRAFVWPEGEAGDRRLGSVVNLSMTSPSVAYTPAGGSPMNNGVLMDQSGDVSLSINNAHLSVDVYPYHEPGWLLCLVVSAIT